MMKEKKKFKDMNKVEKSAFICGTIVKVILLLLCIALMIVNIYNAVNKAVGNETAYAESTKKIQIGVLPNIENAYAYFGTYVLTTIDYVQYKDIENDIINNNTQYIELINGGLYELYADDYFIQWGNPYSSWEGYLYFGINIKHIANSEEANVKFYIADKGAESIADEPLTNKIIWLTPNESEEYYFKFLLAGIESKYNGNKDYKYQWVDRFFNLSCRQLTNPSQYDTGYQNGYNEGETNGRGQGIEIGYGNGYNEGYNDGMAAAGGGAELSAIFFLEPMAKFFGTPIFGTFSIGDMLSVLVFVGTALIFIKMFAGG